MRKLFAILLAVVFCFSIVACGGETNPNAEKEEMVIGEWKTLDGHTVTFNEDGTGIAANGSEMSWKYDAETDCYLLSMTFSGKIETWKCEYKNEDGIRSLSIGGSVVYHADDYEKVLDINKTTEMNDTN